MPEFPIVDTHVHFYDVARFSYPEIAGAPDIHRTHLPADLDHARGEVEIEKIVFVEVAAADEHQIGEVEFASGLADADPRIQAIVAAAPVEDGAGVDATLDVLSDFPLVRGIRRLIQSHPDPEFCARPEFIEGVRRVGRRGLHFEICIYHNQFGAALELARLCPDTRLILDHIGKPAIRHDVVEPWWSQIRALARLPNVACKVSGVISEDDPDHWSEAHVRPYLDRVFDAFGIERVMFGSDWPVSDLTHRYPDWVAILDRFTAGFSDDERRRFYRDNAVDFYRMD